MTDVSAPTARTVAYDEAPLRLVHVSVAVAASGGEFCDGFGLGIIGISLERAAPVLGLTPLWMGLLGGASLAGLFFGALLSGPAADHFGRRPLFAYNMAALALLTCLQFFVQSSVQLLLLRLAIGLVLGTDYSVNKPILIEQTPRTGRGPLLSLLAVAWAAGYSTAYIVGYALDAPDPDRWRWMLVTAAVPCLLVLPLRLSVPESPLWLMQHGQRERALAIVQRRFGGQVALPQAPAEAPAGGRWGRLFSPPWRKNTLVACAFFTCMVIPYFAVGTFVSLVMAAMHLQSAYGGGIVYNVTLLGGAIAGLLVVNRLSRRGFLIGSFVLSGIAMLLLTVLTGLPPVGIILLFAVFAGVLSSASSLLYVYLPELFPTDLRASGIGLASAISRTGSAVSTFLLPVLVSAYGIRVALAACVAVLGIGALVCQIWAPETRDLPLGALDGKAPEGLQPQAAASAGAPRG